MLTIVADSNIAHLHDYFNLEILGCAVNLVAMAGRDITAETLAIHQPDALIIRSVTEVNGQLLDANSSVRFVGSATIGTDHVNEGYLSLRGIRFANAAGCSKDSVAQYVITAIAQLRPDYLSNPVDSSVTLGIIGLGNIGSSLARYALDLGWQVLGYDPFLSQSSLNNASFEQVITQSNVISLHVPLTQMEQNECPTHHLIDSSVFAKMPQDTMLINTARGAVISESDLVKELLRKDSVTRRQVVLDVFEYEPKVASILLDTLPIATPHIAGYTLEGKLRGTQMIFDKFIKVFEETVNINQSQLMDSFLPNNPYHWSELKANPSLLPTFYNIQADDTLLRQSVDSEADAVLGQTFDALRKNYALRREWLFG